MKVEPILAIVYLVMNTILLGLLGLDSMLSLMVIGYSIIILSSSYMTYKKEYTPAKEEIEPNEENLLVKDMARSIKINFETPIEKDRNSLFDNRSMYGDIRLKRIREQFKREKESDNT